MAAAMRRLPLLLTLGSLLFATSADAAKQRTKTHVVQPGETAWKIARARGCSLADLQRLNALDSEAVLQVGDELKLPVGATTTKKPRPPSGAVHVVAAGETLSAIATTYKTSVAALRELNDLPTTVIQPGQSLRVGTPATPAQVSFTPGQSVGRPHRGKLRQAARLPHDPGYYRRRLERTYAAQHVVDQVRNAITEVRSKHRGLHRLAIGDLSKKRGGPASGHASHQSGRDVDLGLYFKVQPEGYPQEFVRAKDAKLHKAATWDLVHALYKASKKNGGPERIFLGYGVQEELYAYAKSKGISKTVLGAIFQYPNGRWTKQRLVQHEPHHGDHLHVRFGCPAKDPTCR